MFVRSDVGVGRKRGVLQTSNRERVPKVLMSIRPAMRKPMPNEMGLDTVSALWNDSGGAVGCQLVGNCLQL